jgi:hemerythrin-like domain-containing protein
MADVFEVLASDHALVRGMLDELERLIPVDGSHPYVDQQRREDLLERLIMTESQHEAAEEMHFWPVVRQRVADGEALASVGLAQEQAAKRTLDTIRRAAPDFAELRGLLADAVVSGRAHIDYEEQQVWPKLRAAISGGDAEEMASSYLSAKEGAPTRPHPSTPPDPTVLKTAGKAAAMMDKIRDKISGRGPE